MCHFYYLGNRVYIHHQRFYNKLGISLPDIPVPCVSIFIVYAPGGKRRRVNAGPLDGQNLFSWTIIFVLTVPIFPEQSCTHRVPPPSTMNQMVAVCPVHPGH